MKKYLSIILVTCLIISMLPVLKLTSYAEVPSTQKVVKHSSTWGDYPFIFHATGAYYTIEDSTGIPNSTLALPTYFYTNDNVTFKNISGLKLITTTLNLGLGIIMDPDSIPTFSNAFWSAIGGVVDGNNKAQGALYDNNNNFLGYCINDISGCYWYENNDDLITIPNEFVDDIYNYYNYDINLNSPDYFTFYPFSNEYIKKNLQTSFNSTQLNDFDTLCNNNNFIYSAYFDKSTGKFSFYNRYNAGSGTVSYSNNVSYLVNTNDSTWANFCEKCVSDNECLATELKFLYDAVYCNFNVYDSAGNQISTSDAVNPYTGQVLSPVTWNGSLKLSPNYCMLPFNFDKITVYKSTNIKNEFDNHIYTPTSYTTDSYKNYNVNSNNEINTTTTTVDNSTTYNESSYNDSSEDFYNYYTNNTYDQSQQITNNTTIINNYYGNGNNDPDNPDNPVNPDNPDDNQTLDAILAAILRFFNAIGDIIGTVLAGLVNMISAVLESIAELTSDITNLSDFFGSLLAWLPDPVPQVLGVGLSLVIIAGVIKFIRG